MTTTLLGRPVLLLVDPQGGALVSAAEQSIPCVGAEEAFPVMIRVRDAARRAGIPILVTQELHRGDGIDFGRELDGSEKEHCVEGTAEAELIPELRPQGPMEYHVIKRRYSGFFGTDLDLLLRGLGARTLVMAGGLTDVCLHYTAVDAHQLDYHIRVLRDATPASTERAREASLAAIEYLQKGAVITSEDAIESFETYSENGNAARSSVGFNGGRQG
jgi:nicotinamidase-related amidase